MMKNGGRPIRLKPGTDGEFFSKMLIEICSRYKKNVALPLVYSVLINEVLLNI